MTTSRPSLERGDSCRVHRRARSVSKLLRRLYATAGTYEAALRVKVGRGEVSLPVTVRVDPGKAPQTPKIESSTPDKPFRGGETIALRGSATDAEDDGCGLHRRSAGRLPELAGRGLRHNTREHPFVPPTTGNNITFTTPTPEDLDAAANSLLVVYLTVTDSKGLRVHCKTCP